MVCGLSIHVVQGLVEGIVEALDEALDGNRLQPRLDPAPGRCCGTVIEVAWTRLSGRSRRR